MSTNNQGMIAVPPEFIEDQLKFIGLSSDIVKRALDELHVYRAMQKKAADARAETLAHLVRSGLIPKGREKQAEAMLADHQLTYSLLKNAVDIYAQRTKQAGDVGKSVSEKEAGLSVADKSYNSLEDNYVGRRTSEKKASDLAILAVLDAPS